MKDVEKVTGSMGEGEAMTPAEEVASVASAAAPRADGDADADADIAAEGVVIAPAQKVGALPGDAASDPWQALVQVGAQFVAALAAANSLDAPAHPWIERDSTAGAQSLKMPLPPRETTKQLANVLSALADGLRGWSKTA